MTLTPIFQIRMTRSFIVATAAFCCLAASGCGNGGPTLVAAGGRITDGGKAVVGASVSYQPIATSKENIYPGPASFAITDSEGRYQLRTFNHDLPGAVPGQHRINISLPAAGEQRDFAVPVGAKKVPVKFCDGSTVVEVPSKGATDLNFDLAQQ
jgi:hypothetical protein